MTSSRGDKVALVGHLQTKSRSPMRMSRLCAVLAVTVGAPLVYAAFAIGAAFPENCCSPAGKDWPYTTGNLGGWGYTSLTQINRKNIEQLGPAWVTHVSAEPVRSEEHTSELQSLTNLVCRLLLEKKKTITRMR